MCLFLIKSCVCTCMGAQSCLTFCGPKDCWPPGSFVDEISQARIVEWVAISSTSGSSWSRDQTLISCISCIGRWILYHLGSPILLNLLLMLCLKGLRFCNSVYMKYVKTFRGKRISERAIEKRHQRKGNYIHILPWQREGRRGLEWNDVDSRPATEWLVPWGACTVWLCSIPKSLSFRVFTSFLGMLISLICFL